MEESLFDIHKKLTGDELKAKAKKRRTIKNVEDEFSLAVTELKKEVILLKNLLRFYIHDDWE